MAAPTTEPADAPPRAIEPPPGLPVVLLTAVVTGVAGAWAPYLRTAENPSLRSSAGWLAATALTVAASLAPRPALRGRATAAPWLAALGVTAVATMLLSSSAGRAPVLVACAGAAIAGACVTGGSRVVRAAPAGVAALLVAEVAWWHGASNPVIGALMAAASAVALLTRGRTVHLRVPSALRSSATWRAAAIASALSAVIPLPIWRALAAGSPRLTSRIHDFKGHIDYAAFVSWWPPKALSPHFLFPVLVRIVQLITRDATAAGITVVALSNAALTLMIYGVARRSWSADRPPLGRATAAVFAAALLIADTPALLLPAGEAWWMRAPADPNGIGGGLFIMHFWASPTSLLAAPLSILLFLGVLDVLTGSPRPIVGPAWAMAVLTIATALAKPPLVLVLLLAAPWYALRSGLDRGGRRHLALGLIGPGVLVVAFQAVFLTTGMSPYERTSWTVAPFWLVGVAQLYRPILWTGGLVVLIGCWAGGRRYLGSPPVRLALMSTAVAAVPTFLLQETGRMATHGNLAWTMVFALLVLLVVTLHFLTVEAVEVARPLRSARGGSTGWRRWPPWTVAFAAWGALALAGGAMHLLVLAGVTSY